MDFKVEAGVSFPERKERTAKYPFWKMEVGDSFAFPSDLHRRVVSAASAYGSEHDRKYSVIRTGDGYRCWRTA